MESTIKCYRVWMKDGYASLHDASSEAEARELAIAMAKRNIEGAAMSPVEKRRATAVDFVTCLDR